MSDGTARCTAMMHMLMEADPAELRGERDSPLTRHVRVCASCAAAAGRILEAQQELSDAISTLTDTSPPAGRAAATRHDPPATPAHERTVPTRSARARRLGISGAAASLAAAALVVILLQQRRSDDPPVREPLTEHTAMALAVPVVSVTAGDDVAIMHTANPNLTVVWYLKRERR